MEPLDWIVRDYLLECLERYGFAEEADGLRKLSAVSEISDAEQPVALIRAAVQKANSDIGSLLQERNAPPVSGKDWRTFIIELTGNTGLVSAEKACTIKFWAPWNEVRSHNRGMLSETAKAGARWNSLVLEIYAILSTIGLIAACRQKLEENTVWCFVVPS